MDKKELLTKMVDGRKKFLQALEHMEEDQIVAEKALYETWSVKELLAHLGYWDQWIAAVVIALQTGHPVTGLGEMTVDEINARVHAANHERPLEDVRREEQDAYQSLLSLVEQAAEGDLFNPQRFAWTQGQPLQEFIANNTYEHYEEHLPDLLAWMDQDKS